MYDFAGEWVYHVGLPAKSGVGGGIIAVLPGQLGIGVFSPPLDERGNSVRGIKVCEELSDALRPARVLRPRPGRGPDRGGGSARRRLLTQMAPADPGSLALEPLRQRLAEVERRFDVLAHSVIPIGVTLLGTTRDFGRLLEVILAKAQALCHADGGTVYLAEADHLRFAIVRNTSLGIAFGGAAGDEVPFPPVPLVDPDTGAPNLRNVATRAAITGELVDVPDAYAAEGFEFSGTLALDRRSGYRSRSFLTVPLKSNTGVVTGVLQLLNATDHGGDVIPFDPGFHPVIEALSRLAAAALEVARREDEMRKEFQALHIQIDETKRARRVSEITDTDYFRRLQGRARTLRERS